MSSIKQLPVTRSFSVVQSNTVASVIRIDRQNSKSRDSNAHDSKSYKTIPAIVLRLALEALGRFSCDVACIIADALIAALSWLFQEFLAGCATYAEAMYPIAAVGERDSALNHSAPERVGPTPAATRLRLVIVTDAAQDLPRPHDQLPLRQAAGGTALRDWTPSQDIETIGSGRAPAARRKNGPR